MKTLNAPDTISGREGRAYAKINGNNEELFFAKSVEASVEKSKSEVKAIGKRMTGHKTTGANGTGSMTLYYLTPLLRQMLKEWKDTGVDVYFDLVVENDDPASSAGKQSILLMGCNLDSVVLTKLDGDTRGGAALSVRAVTGKPIKFSGTGEKLSEIEPFHPDRMASRILGMGDVLTLIDKASEAFDQEDAEKLAKKARTADLTLDDFLDQMQSMKKTGGIKSMLEMLPGMSGKDIDVDENAMKKPEAIIRSMTPKERRNPGVLNASRRKRIAAGSGTTVQDVNQLIRQFDQAKQMMKQVTQMKGKGRMRMRFPGMR